MSYKCLECGHIFEDGKEDVWEESRGEFWGATCTETITGCPECMGDYEEAEKCEICGIYNYQENVFGGVCKNCIEKVKNDFDVCFQISKQDKKQNIKINPLVYSLLGDELEIESVLVEYIKKTKNIDCSDYIEQDISWFGERLAEEVNK